MKTLVIGASENTERYSYKAISLLREHGHEVIAFGPKAGKVGDIEFETEWKNWKLDTVTLYIGPSRQTEFFQKIIDLKPRRVIFNPGTENQAFFNALKAEGIFYEEACTLVLLNTGQY